MSIPFSLKCKECTDEVISWVNSGDDEILIYFKIDGRAHIDCQSYTVMGCDDGGWAWSEMVERHKKSMEGVE